HEIPNADPGNTIACETEQNEVPLVLQPVWDFQSDLPVLDTSLQVAFPAGWKCSARWLRHAAVEPVEKSADSMRWQLHDIAGIRPEPRMRPLSSVAGRAVIDVLSPSETKPQTWSEIAAWFARL